MAARVFIGETLDVALVFDDAPLEDIVAVMRQQVLPDQVRWQSGSLVHRVVDGQRMGHGILTRDPLPGTGETRAHEQVLCSSADEAPGEVADAVDRLQMTLLAQEFEQED